MMARRGAPVAPQRTITPANRQAFEEGIKKLPDFSDFHSGPPSAAVSSVGGPFGAAPKSGTFAASPQALRSPDSTPTGVLGPRPRAQLGGTTPGMQP